MPAIQMGQVGFFGQYAPPQSGEIKTYTEYSPTYAIYYSYRVIKGLKIGGTLAYYRAQEKDATQDTEYSVVAMHNYNTWNVSFDVRYEWFNRGVVTLIQTLVQSSNSSKSSAGGEQT